MPSLPRLDDSSFLVRTDFANDDAWQELSDEAQQENQDGFRAYLVPVSDPAFDHLDWEAVRAALPAGDRGALVLFSLPTAPHSTRQIIQCWSWISAATPATAQFVASPQNYRALRTT